MCIRDRYQRRVRGPRFRHECARRPDLLSRWRMSSPAKSSRGRSATKRQDSEPGSKPTPRGRSATRRDSDQGSSNRSRSASKRQQSGSGGGENETAPGSPNKSSADTGANKLMPKSKLEEQMSEIMNSCKLTASMADDAKNMSAELQGMAEACVDKSEGLLSINVASKVLTAAGKFKSLYVLKTTEPEHEIKQYGKFGGDYDGNTFCTVCDSELSPKDIHRAMCPLCNIALTHHTIRCEKEVESKEEGEDAGTDSKPEDSGIEVP
eukprot:TRINITY_DN231_c0_g1_i3.p1 TRINITY_DN231_c0_g1~~TRINITY_DN231_c0_g1_i3.p1  ORF type:complete len:265 (+),score=40.47 TRINITY_DN231_c0_g1_i3:160-954(+)